MPIRFVFAALIVHYIFKAMKRRLLKFIKIAALITLVLIGALSAIIFLSEQDEAVIKNYVNDESLAIIKAGWRGTPFDEKGRFVNVEFPFLPKVSDMLRWQLGARPQKEEKRADTERLAIKDPTGFLNSEADGMLWFGHASFLIRLSGVNILLDPVFGEPKFITRLITPASPLKKLRKVDYILISHDHRDHCDEATIEQLTSKFPDAKIIVGLRMNELLDDWKSPETEIQTVGWYQQFETDPRVKISFLPVRHWSRRGLFDTNWRLWGGFVIEGAGKTVYFSGDSGYGSHYAELAELFPKIDYFIVGIGAYQPNWFMRANHNSPSEAFQGFLDSKADALVPMHFGRFDLSDEPPSEPLRLLKEKAAEANVSGKIKNLQINESISF
jgi:L-ascorbate metabolism protein UlaG (beta-lactamase superfamily)